MEIANHVISVSKNVIIVHIFLDNMNKTSKTPFEVTDGASKIVGLARAKLRRGTSN